MAARVAYALAAVAMALLGFSLLFANLSLRPKALTLYMATTTSVKDTGLLDVLIADFEQWAGQRGFSIEVRFTAVGTGQALRMAARGDVDLVIVHSPPLERLYLENGSLVCRYTFAYNFFLIVGPLSDPAQAGGNSAVEAFRRIAEAGREGRALFITRHDLSGTHLKELELWRLALGQVPDPLRDSWYMASGAGMAQTLLIANEKLAYTLSDTGTWLRLRERLDGLRVIVGASSDLLNVYSLDLAKSNQASLLLLSYLKERGASLLSSFTVAGAPLFYPLNAANSTVSAWIRPYIFGPECPSAQSP